jgi:ribonuclease R
MSKNKLNRNPSQQILAESILKLMHQNVNKDYNYRQLAKELGATDKEAKIAVSEALILLTQQGILIEPEPGKYKSKPVMTYVTGTIDITTSGAAYVILDKAEGGAAHIKEDDIYIAPKNVHNALNKDKVEVYLYAKRKDKKQEGEVVRIIQRAKTDFVGVIKISERFAFMIPDSHKMNVDIFIPLKNLHEAKDGQKVVARISDWPKGAKNPFGEIITVLGYPGENNTEMDSILVEYGFPLEFPEKVENEARDLPVEITQAEIAKRNDFRKVTTFTIDPFDAKDFDDALSIQKLENGRWEVGVHIADVSHYIRPKTALEDEAYERATSVYLVDRVIPMLPEMLSNKVCSLRPHEEKLCFSAVFEMDDAANILEQWFGKTVILSDHRFTYEEAQDIIEGNEGPLKDEILILDRLSKELRKKRFKEGSIAFEKAEVKFKLDEAGNPLGVYIKESKDSNKLIEDFMLLANRKVAEFIGRAKKGQQQNTFVYRVHDKPVTDRLATFAQFAGKFGYIFKTGSDKEIANSLNQLLKDVSGKKEQNVLEQLAIRTMSKAIYTTKNIGHYGLAFDFYSHFTSPIRRYPDVMVHRLLEHYLAGGATVDAEVYEAKCKHSSEMESRAAEAERASVKFKQVQFLQDKKGQIFEGLISGVTDWGIYVEIIENKCEGLIRMRDISDDFYEFDEENYCIIGRRHRKRYQLGDNVMVKIKNTDLTKKQIDFTLMTSDAPSEEGQHHEGAGGTPFKALFDETSPGRSIDFNKGGGASSRKSQKSKPGRGNDARHAPGEAGKVREKKKKRRH